MGMVRKAISLAIAGCVLVWLGAVAPASARSKPEPIKAHVVKVSPKQGGGEPSIAVGPEGNEYVSFPSNDGMSFFRSFNGGEKWSPGAIADSGSGDTTVNVDSSGAVYQGNLNGNFQGDVYKSFDAGASWPQKGTSV